MRPRTSIGRPIVVVTGIGVVTSLGAGKDDNWAKLTAGASGIRAITPLPDRRPEDPHRRHHRFRAAEPYCTAALSERLAELAAEEAIAEVRHRHARRFSRARCSSPCRRSNWNGRSASTSAPSSRRQRHSHL